MNNPGNWRRDEGGSPNASGVQNVADAYGAPPSSHGYAPPQYPMAPVSQHYPAAPISYPYANQQGYGQPVVVVQQVVRHGGRTRGTAVLLAFFLGGIGIHKFYLGRPFAGIMYVLFCWTFVPALLSWIDILIMLCSSEQSFERTYNNG